MHEMFRGAASFNADISNWNVLRVTNMQGMFIHAAVFNNDISKWDVSSVTHMDYMFWGAQSFRINLCGPAWVFSMASKTLMFDGSHGLISEIVCTSDTIRQYVTRRPLTERELKIMREPIKTPVSTSTLAITSINTMACPKCGAFAKSGRVSCCAPRGAWYKNCGVAVNRNADHRWFEGVAACKRKSKPNPM